MHGEIINLISKMESELINNNNRMIRLFVIRHKNRYPGKHFPENNILLWEEYLFRGDDKDDRNYFIKLIKEMIKYARTD